MTAPTACATDKHWLGLLVAPLLAVVLALTGIVGLRPAVAAELIMFEEAGCSWCRRWDEEVGVGYSRSEEGRRAPLRRIHISRARSSGLRLAAPVTVTPTFVLVEGNAEIGRITGYPGADFFWGLLGELLARLGPSPAERPAREVPRDARLDSHHWSEPQWPGRAS